MEIYFYAKYFCWCCCYNKEGEKQLYTTTIRCKGWKRVGGERAGDIPMSVSNLLAELVFAILHTQLQQQQEWSGVFMCMCKGVARFGRKICNLASSTQFTVGLWTTIIPNRPCILRALYDKAM